MIAIEPSFTRSPPEALRLTVIVLGPSSPMTVKMPATLEKVAVPGIRFTRKYRAVSSAIEFVKKRKLSAPGIPGPALVHAGSVELASTW